MPAEQKGWTLDWNKTFSIQTRGIVVSRIGPQAADGSNFDLQYVPDDGWNYGGNTSEVDNWPSTMRPGPATINGFIMAGAATSPPLGMVARIGDTIDWINQDNDMIAYIEVTGVNDNGVAVDMWTWNKNGT